MNPKEQEAYNKALAKIESCRKSGGKRLDLSEMDLTQLPPEIGELTALKELSIGRNQLTNLPPEIGELTALMVFDLWSNRLTSLPPEIGQLNALRKIDLGENQLTSLPSEIGQLTALKVLRLYDNQLQSLPSEIIRLEALSELLFGGNQLQSLPSEVSQLTALTKLNLFDNQLKSLPPEIVQLTALKVLSLARNRLKSLPAEIVQLTALTELDIFQNELQSLPSEIAQLKALKALSLNDNQLQSLPSEIVQLTVLTKLFLHGNPGLGIPEETLGPIWEDVVTKSKAPKSPREILDAYFRLQGESGAPLQECKVIVVGRGGVGKTSLIKRLSGQPYDPKEPETHGIQRQKLTFHGQKGTVLGRVWDFGGQAILHSMHEFFLTARSLYILVLGERDDMLERDAIYWLQMIRSYAGKAPVVVVLNKSGGRKRQFDRASLERDHGPILGWVTTECSEPDMAKGGITELEGKIASALDSDLMETVRRKFPKKWRSIKDEIESMDDSFLSYEDFQKKCRKHGEKDKKEQSALAAELHDLGIAMNYARDPRLMDTTVLKPDWLGNGIYAVLRANDRDEKLQPRWNKDLAPGATITAESLVAIHQKAEAWKMLKAADYPADKREFLLHLMDLFHLSYPLDDEGKKQLVPSLLDPTPPPGSDEPEGEDRIRLRFEFPVVPAPLLPWFIARIFSLIPEKRHWRRGAMLRYADATAKVWAAQDEKYVFVTVAGPEQVKKRLLAIIRGTLYKIMAEYKALCPVEQWENDGDWVPVRQMVKFGLLEEEMLPNYFSIDLRGVKLSEESDLCGVAEFQGEEDT